MRERCRCRHWHGLDMPGPAWAWPWGRRPFLVAGEQRPLAPEPAFRTPSSLSTSPAPRVAGGAQHGGRSMRQALADAPSKPVPPGPSRQRLRHPMRLHRPPPVPRASPVPALPRRTAHRRLHTMATPPRAITSAPARKRYITATPAPFHHRTTSPTPSSTPCLSLESGGSTPRRNRIHLSCTDPSSIRTPQPPPDRFPPPRSSPEHRGDDAVLAGVNNG